MVSSGRRGRVGSDPDRKRRTRFVGVGDPANPGRRGHRVPDREQTIGQFVRARRRANRLTQAQLGELAGVGRRLVVELERDKPTLRMDAVNAVLSVFGKALGVVDAPRAEIYE